MLVVNDRHISDFVVTGDSIAVFGDTSFSVHFRFAADPPRDRIVLLVRTEGGNVITMSHQGLLARPLWGQWIGAPGRNSDRQILLRMLASGVAYWRWSPGSAWTEGEWDRFHRQITFLWLPDSTTWEGMYDPMAGQMLFNETIPESGITILRRFFRRP